jgi:hypothetical protein
MDTEKRFVEQEREADNFYLTSCNVWFETATNEMHVPVRSSPDTVFYNVVLRSRNVSPKVVVECLTLLLRIREVSGSNLGPENGYSDWGF